MIRIGALTVIKKTKMDEIQQLQFCKIMEPWADLKGVYESKRLDLLLSGITKPDILTAFIVKTNHRILDMIDKKIDKIESFLA